VMVAAPAHVAATITAHHLLYNRNALFTGGLRPHYYCLPVLKRETHRLALVQAATSGNPKFFLGTDSAPHAVLLKEHASGCAGCYTAHAALELYAEAFESASSVTLQRQSWTVPERYPYGQADLKPLRAGEALGWRLQPAGA